jgi:hypothetical protein
MLFTGSTNVLQNDTSITTNGTGTLSASGLTSNSISGPFVSSNAINDISIGSGSAGVIVGTGYTAGGAYNIGIGIAGNPSFNTSFAGSYCVGIGGQNLISSTNAASNYNVAIGYSALQSGTDPYNIVALGYQALKGSSSSTAGPHDCVVIGYQAGFKSNAASNNVAIGSGALYSVITGSNETAVGYNALNLATGTGNTAIGSGAGSAVTSGAYNVLIGAYTGSAAPVSATGSNWIVLSDGQANIAAQWSNASKNWTFTNTINTTAYTVATLPTAGTAGRRAYVTDATAPTFLGTLTGGGTVKCPVFDNGTAWVAG